MVLLVAVAIIAMFATPLSAIIEATPRSKPFTGSVASAQVRVAVQLADPNLHPRQLAYDTRRNGLWFWTSAQQGGTTFTNTVYFYDISTAELHPWPLYSGDWSSQLLAGLAVAPDGDVWIGWNHNLLDFRPASGTYTRYVLPASIRYPLPAAVLGNLPADLGVADIAVAPDGVVWIARYGALSLTNFSPISRTFHEIPLPATAGDPAKLAIARTGQVFFTTNLSADHPGYAAEKVGEYDPQTGKGQVFTHPAQALAVAPNGDLYTVMEGRGFGVSRGSAAELSSAAAQHRAPAFEHWNLPFDVDGTALATDVRGRVWVAVGGAPQVAVLDPATGSAQTYQYAAPSVAGHPLPFNPGSTHNGTAPANAVWLVHIVAMATDSQGHLWYIRAGYSSIEEVSA